ncbi:hippocampus abundant transcript 1 -like [Brachionus plicatilis]|uniref:Hippocampus abundant transcript 1-like n=1 Tax=Brachionus plicatilis TaxID=10195 RepID=A0A3M7PXB8_BRAPC|nr:hippocampus abundant transcript 1 -like [Brachionus plicatilis]
MHSASSSSKTKRKRASNLLSNNPIQHGYVSSGIGKASFVHALIVIFLEFFAWGLLTDQVITVLNETFPSSTFLANGLIHGVKGILSFLSAPLIGALSDIWGRKVFLLITVFFTCLPIPLMRINPMWYFAMISISGLFAVTFSVVFAYVADVTDESNRTTAYGLVSATFAASLITSPALGSYLSRFYSENFVIALATAIAVFDLFFILVAVPESLPEKLRERSKSISWENVDPFKSLKSIFKDRTILLLCIITFLSYLPEAGQYSCFFVYLKLIVGFTQNQVAYFIAYIGILSCIAQAAILVILIKYFGNRQSIMIGLTFQVLQLAIYGFAGQEWLIWFAGLLAALSSIGYPAISAFISNQSHVDQQGVSQGMVTGIRGLCNGIGPAMYGFLFWIFRVNLNENSSGSSESVVDGNSAKTTYATTHLLPGPPFLFGSALALVAIFVTLLIPAKYKPTLIFLPSSSNSKPSEEKDTAVVRQASNPATTVTYNRGTSGHSNYSIKMDLMKSEEKKSLLNSDEMEEDEIDMDSLIEKNYSTQILNTIGGIINQGPPSGASVLNKPANAPNLISLSASSSSTSNSNPNTKFLINNILSINQNSGTSSSAQNFPNHHPVNNISNKTNLD